MLKGIKFRLYPNDEQIHKLAQIFGCVRYVYNKAVEAYLYAKEQHLKYPTYEELKRMLYR